MGEVVPPVQCCLRNITIIISKTITHLSTCILRPIHTVCDVRYTSHNIICFGRNVSYFLSLKLPIKCAVLGLLLFVMYIND